MIPSVVRQLGRSFGPQAVSHAHHINSTSLFARRLSSAADGISENIPEVTLPGDLTASQTIVHHPISALDPYLDPEHKTSLEELKDAKFAVIKMCGTQYKVAMDDVVVTDLIHGYDIGETIENEDVLLIGSQNETIIGRPLVNGAKVSLTVEEITKDEKVVAFKKKRRKGYQRKKGFRRDVLILRVKDISVPEQGIEQVA